MKIIDIDVKYILFIVSKLFYMLLVCDVIVVNPLFNSKADA